MIFDIAMAIGKFHARRVKKLTFFYIILIFSVFLIKLQTLMNIYIPEAFWLDF